MSLEDFLAGQTCDICLKAKDQDTTGAPSRDPYVVVVGAVTCLVDDQGGDVEQRNQRRTMARAVKVYIGGSGLPANFRLTAKHQLRVPDFNGRVFVIQNVIDPNELGHHLEVTCEEVTA